MNPSTDTLSNKDILQILHQSATWLDLDLDSKVLREVDDLLRHYTMDDVQEFIRDLSELGNGTGIFYVKKEVKRADFDTFIHHFDAPMVILLRHEGKIVPAMIHTNKKHRKEINLLYPDGSMEIADFAAFHEDEMVKNKQGELIFLAVFANESVAGSLTGTTEEDKRRTPVQRLFHLLAAERKDIFYVYVYAIIIGVTSLILPLGIQAAIELISGGVFFSSVYFLIGIIILAVLGSGVLQVLQITIVEYLQRRIFVKAAFEFAYRVPRIRMEAVLNLHFPELMNRFFDVLTLQKGLPKLLIDLSTGIIQILFGLLLLSFYHPFFIFFGLALIFMLFMIFYFTGPKGLQTSIEESKYKYKAVYWLEELARALYSFKLSGTTDLPMKRTDRYVNNYLKNRKKHFRILITQYSYVLFFKAVVTAGLLIIGTILVVQREITLGQFVASEVIIILILNSVEKIIMYMDVVYDMLTAVDKIAHVTDLPLDQTGGIDVKVEKDQGFGIEIQNLRYTYPFSKEPSIKDVNLNINPGEHVCISGVGGSGKTTLINAMAGMFTTYEGSVTYNKYSLRDIDRVYLRDRIGKNVSSEDIFEGTVLDNVLVGKPYLDEGDAIEALNEVNILDHINAMPNGLHTRMVSAGKGFSETLVQKIILARCLAKKPNLLILNDFFNNFPKQERLELIQLLTDKHQTWTLVVVSNDPMIMAACDRIIYLKDGAVLVEGNVQEVLLNEEVVANLN